MALWVLVDHIWPIGYAQPSLGPLAGLTHEAASSVPVIGFMVLSGFFLARASGSQSWLRFAWHRLIRLMPALWVSLAVCAFVMGPIISVVEDGSLTTFVENWQAAVTYATGNLAASMGQYGIPGLLDSVPYTGGAVGGTVFNGSLWTLKYEFVCYLGLTVLLALALAGRRRLLLATTVLTWSVVAGWWLARCVADSCDQSNWRPPIPGGITLPLLGDISAKHTAVFGLAFVIGVCFHHYQQWIPVSGAYIAAASAILTAALVTGTFAVVGIPALAYVVIAAIAAMPKRPAAWGAHHDYSYGVFLYAFPVSQLLTLFGVASLGFVAFTMSSIAVTVALGAASLRFVELPTRRWRHWNPPRRAKVRGIIDLRRYPDHPPAPTPARSVVEPVVGGSETVIPRR